MFKPDQPIKSCKEDTLDRCSFAQSLGNAILSYKEKDSIVIGLFGTWGSGKTSIINMTLEHIDLVSKKKIDEEKPIIVRFNPWNYSDQNQLIMQFFRQLSVALRRVDYAREVKKAGEKLEIYAKFFEPFAFIPTVGLLFKGFKIIGSAAKNWSDLKSNDLNATRSELNELLSKQSHRIIIVIDDIDRLNNTEIRQIFQLIKLLGDFPNTMYLLAFDRDVVINALDKVQESPGARYLEKIIQIPFEVPLISKKVVERLLLTQIEQLIKDVPQNRWDRNHWLEVYHGGFKYFFKNIRDVIRYINALQFNLEMVKSEVNVIDFLAITGIQVFLPEVYYGIRDNKDIFAGIFDTYGRVEAQKDQAKKRCNEIIERSNKLPQDTLINFLKQLFPKIKSLYENIFYSHDHLGNWRKEGRICSPEIFDTFFRSSLPKGEISQKEIETILSLGNNPDSFTEALLKLNEDGRIVRFLERLEDYTQSDIPEENIEPIITVLMDIGDLFPEGDTGFLGTDTPMRLLRILYQLSHRFDNQEKRFNIFAHAIEKATRSLYTMVHEVAVQDQQHGKYDPKITPKPEEKQTVNSDQLKELEKLACTKIESWAEDGRLKKHKYLSVILFKWKVWGEQDKVNNFIDSMIKTDTGLVMFIISFLSESTIYSGYVKTTHWRIRLKDIEEFVNLEKIESRIRRIFSSSDFGQLEDRKKLAIKVFLDTIDGKIKEAF